MERMQLMIGRLLTIGVLISLFLVAIGGGAYLITHASDTINYRIFHGEPQIYTSLFDILHDAITFSPLAIVQLGILILVIVQILRVALTAWFFAKFRDYFFVSITLFILALLIFSLLRH